MSTVRTTATAPRELRTMFAEAGLRGHLFARDIDGPAAVGLDEDTPVALASVFKIPIALAYACEAEAGRLDRTERHPVPLGLRDGGIGVSGCADPVEMSLRDLVGMMLTMSDNAATDVVLRRVGLDRVNELLALLGRHDTHLVGGCSDIVGALLADLGAASLAEAQPVLAALPAEEIMRLSVCVPGRTTRSTARDTAALLVQIWRDEAGPAAACREVRDVMARQIWPHRLASGFGDDYRVAGKTGTLPGWRNEAGVVEHRDGGRYAVAVFTRAATPQEIDPEADRAIGRAARIAVDALRASAGAGR
ncbi:serine hydrolase [Streptomyces sp. NPDC094032]|uniref:serine hydrolase n=1 Tax=Streptomyces sp. NPDC094032 TaxID=3155308 RepID=UPI003329A024